MALTQPNLGAAPNDGTGSTLRELGQIVKDIITNMWDTVTGGIAYLGGSVGIGIIPEDYFHLHKSTNSDVTIKITNSNSGSTASDGLSMTLQASTSNFILNNREAASISIRTAATERLVIASDGKVDIQGVYDETTASAENVFVATDGSLRRSTSSEKLKDILEPISIDYSKNIYKIAKEAAIFYKSLCNGDNPEHTFYGLSAEKLALIDPRLVHFGYCPEDYETLTKDIEVEEVVKSKIPFGKDKIVKVIKQEHYKSVKKSAKLSSVGVQYSRIIPLILVEMDKQNDKINDLEKRLLKLEGN